jgi:hypothetical protein
MKAYTYSEARENFASVLEEAELRCSGPEAPLRRQKAHRGCPVDVDCGAWNGARASAWEWREAGRGSLRHIVQRTGAERF